jgi:hypothetical protein
LPVFAFVLLDSQRVVVLEKRPTEFIKSEKVEGFFEIMFWIQIPLWMVLLAVFVNGERIGITENIMSFVPTLFIFLLLIWTGSLMSWELNTIESSALMR